MLNSFSATNNIFLRIRFVLLSLSFIGLGHISAANEATLDTTNDVISSEPEWHTDYMDAYRLARREKKMLLINFLCESCQDDQQELEQYIKADESLQSKLQHMVLLQVKVDSEIEVDAKKEKLLTQAAFREMHGKPGIAIIDLKHEGQPYYGNVVSAFPFTTGKYYDWCAENFPAVVDLPAGTITQRTMVWAVRIHPEKPASTSGQCDPLLTTAATSHSNSQARTQVQGHQGWSGRYQQICSSIAVNDAKEVVAESWPNQTMIDSCIDCVASWRYSSGHWGAVRSRHRLFGYDIKRGRNGIWYGTGIFAN